MARFATTVLAITSSFCASGASFGATPYHLRTTSVQSLAQAFKSICLDHAGDKAGQARTAQAVPWSLRPKKTSGAQNAAYQNWPIQLAIRDEPIGRMCSITSSLPASASAASVALISTPVLNLAASKPEIEAEAIYWEIDPSPGGRSISFELAADADGKVGTFMLLIKKKGQ